MARDADHAQTNGGHEVKLKHYHVLVGLPGYMPNYNCPCRTLTEAGAVALQEARAFREAHYASYWGKYSLGRVVGSKYSGYEVLRPCRWTPPPEHKRDWEVWQTIDIADCYEEECFCQQCGELLQEEEPCYVCGWPLIIEEEATK